MFTSFITVHVDGEPMLINIQSITTVYDNEICLVDGDCFQCDESFEDINNKIVDELSGS